MTSEPMTFGKFLRKLRAKRRMTLRRLGEAAGQDYVILSKVESGLRKPPPLEAIFALSDALSTVKPLTSAEFEKLLDLAARPSEKARPRFTQDEVARLKTSKTADIFFTRRVRGRKEEAP